MTDKHFGFGITENLYDFSRSSVPVQRNKIGADETASFNNLKIDAVISAKHGNRIVFSNTLRLEHTRKLSRAGFKFGARRFSASEIDVVAHEMTCDTNSPLTPLPLGGQRTAWSTRL